MKKEVFSDKVVYTYNSAEERNKHIMKMCKEKPQLVHIFGDTDNLMAEFIKEN